MNQLKMDGEVIRVGNLHPSGSNQSVFRFCIANVRHQDDRHWKGLWDCIAFGPSADKLWQKGLTVGDYVEVRGELSQAKGKYGKETSIVVEEIDVESGRRYNPVNTFGQEDRDSFQPDTVQREHPVGMDTDMGVERSEELPQS